MSHPYNLATDNTKSIIATTTFANANVLSQTRTTNRYRSHFDSEIHRAAIEAATGPPADDRIPADPVSVSKYRTAYPPDHANVL